MIRQTMRPVALALAGLLLASGAWGQVLRQSTSATALIAAEHFGEARVVQASNMSDQAATTNVTETRPFVALNLSGADIVPGNQAEITFQLSGATFDQAASPTNVDRRNANCADAPGNNIEASIVGDSGNRGDASVTYRVEVKDTTNNEALAQNTAICFWLPDLSVTLATISPPGETPLRKGVNVTATIKPLVSSGGTPFPGRISGPAAGDKDADGDGSVAGAEIGNATNTDLTVFQAAPALVTSLGAPGDTVFVNITDRKVIAADGGGTPDPTKATDTQGLRVGTLSLQLSSANIWKLNGSRFLSKTVLDSSLTGSIDLSVAGQFQSGDRVVVGGGPTALSAEIDGMMADVSVPMEPGSMHIVYLPGGVDALKPGTFTAGGSYLFNDRRNANSAIMPMSVGEIKYRGIEVEGYAYGVVRGGASDRSFVRVTCEGPVDCAVFADCTGQDGMNYFEAASVPIANGSTLVWNSDDIEALIGGGWTAGRGRCDFLSNAELSVQHMVRSGGILVNSSAVIGRSLDLRADRARTQIDMVVDNICKSVKGHLGRTEDLTADPAVSGHLPTVCRSADAELIPNDRDTNGADSGV